MQKTNRIWELDALRGIMILGVVWIHLCFDLDYLLGVWRARYELIKDLEIDTIGYGAYDEGGCGCPKCRPWGANGYPTLAKELTKLTKEYFSGIKAKK